MNDMNNFGNTPEARDIANHFHGYTDARRHEEVGPLIIVEGEGIYVTDNSGTRYIEGLAGLWSVSVGFRERRLIDAAMRQMEKLPFYHNFGHKSHGPAIDLAEQLVALAPVPMSKVFSPTRGQRQTTPC